MTATPLIVDVVDLRRELGTVRRIEQAADFEDLRVGEREIVGGRVDLAVDLISITDGVVAAGTVSYAARGPCRRCLEPVERRIDAELQEVFEDDPTEGETWPIDDDRIDLGSVVREEAILSLPVTSLCADGCAGPDPERFPTGEAAEGTDGGDDPPDRDPRWAALDELDLDDAG